MSEPAPELPPPNADQVNRLWQHGMHEERLFHDRLNYFSFLETGLLTICVIMYNKESSIGFFLPVAVVALLLTLLWLIIQVRHWVYVEHVHVRIRMLVPEYRATVEAFAGPGRRDGLSISKPLALAVPALFACTWIALFVWILVRSQAPGTPDAFLTPERASLIVLGAVVGWLVLRTRRLERKLKEAASQK
jgi:hypothetical protein